MRRFVRDYSCCRPRECNSHELQQWSDCLWWCERATKFNRSSSKQKRQQPAVGFLHPSSPPIFHLCLSSTLSLLHTPPSIRHTASAVYACTCIFFCLSFLSSTTASNPCAFTTLVSCSCWSAMPSRTCWFEKGQVCGGPISPKLSPLIQT